MKFSLLLLTALIACLIGFGMLQAFKFETATAQAGEIRIASEMPKQELKILKASISNYQKKQARHETH